MRQISRLKRGGVLAATAALLLAGLPANAAPPGSQPARAPQNSAKPEHVVTLITGDVVRVRDLGGGKNTVEVTRPLGANGLVTIRTVKGKTYVLPDEAMPFVTAGSLDRRLFNITDLIASGYDDTHSAGLPVIASYQGAGMARAMSAPAGITAERALPSINGVAMTASKKDVRAFWNSLSAGAPGVRAFSTGGIGSYAKIWLDGKAKATLVTSVPQVGAPEAWAAGFDGTGTKVAVLDTGIDANHPDIAGQLAEVVSFVPGEDAVDTVGHGTHVAATIAGTGKSDGLHKGVAPGAKLLIGKVLNNEGFGQDSWILAGMEWAVAQGADVVNMSLGDASETDGLDPMSLAVNQLSATSDTLFVIAAGNSGCAQCVSAPGAADAALTVGAVDRDDNLAWFSSQGPRYHDGAVKPDMTAPGVDIEAAHASGAPGEGLYTTMSGTSMATPHIAGAAAIVAQKNPQWTDEQVKAALVSSAKPLAEWYTPHQVGTGRLDIPATLRNTVIASGSITFGNFDWPHEPSDGPVTKPLTFNNFGTSAVTLNLAIAGDGPFSLGANSVTIPAAGTASVNVTGDPTASGPNVFSGTVVGTDAATGTAVTRSSLGMIKEDEVYNLKIKLIGKDGKPADGRVVLYKAGEFWPWALDISGEATYRMPVGVYTASSVLDVPGERADRQGIAVLIDPETLLNKNNEIVLDASKARFLDTAAPQRTETRQKKISYVVSYNDGNSFGDAIPMPVKYDDMYLQPTEPMTQGKLDVSTRWREGEESLSLRVLGLLPVDTTMQPGSTSKAWSGPLRTVFAGNGAAADYAKIDAKGKAVVVNRSDAVAPDERAAAAAAAGAKLLIVANDGAGVLNEWVGEATIPVVTVHHDAGALLALVAKKGLPLTAKQVPYATFVYDLTQNYFGQVPSKSLAYHPSRSDLARIDNSFYSVNDQEGAGFRWDMTFSPSAGFPEREWFPGTRTEWVTPEQLWHENHSQGEFTDVAYLNQYAKGTTTKINWFAPAIHPAFTRAFAVQNSRYQDYMTINVQAWSSSGNDGIEHGGNLGWGSVPTNMKLYQGATLIDENQFSSDMQWTAVPSGRKPYHLVLDASRPDEWRLSTRTHTEWDFISESNTADNFVPFPLLQLDYGFATDLRGDVKAGTTQEISINPVPQGGMPGTGKITSVKLDVSYDDGVTWQKVTLTKGANGKWLGNLKLAKKPGGFVSLRASAATDAGWSISQEIVRAYGLR
jgi:subtilisin family serine protease